MMSKKCARIGIYPGTFDPVHSGHLRFALEAQAAAQLDEVCFVPERMPRAKPDVEHYGHRVAMLRRALAPHVSLSLAELVDKRLTVHKTLPQLSHTFKGQQLVMLVGSDVFLQMPAWPYASLLYETCEFVVALRRPESEQRVRVLMEELGLSSGRVTLVDAVWSGVSSTEVREILAAQQFHHPRVLPSVGRYARREWLYARIA